MTLVMISLVERKCLSENQETVAGLCNTALPFGKLSLVFVPQMVLQGADEAWIVFE